MATLKVYSYFVTGRDIQTLNELKELFTDAISIEISNLGLDEFYNYDSEEKLLIPVTNPDAVQYSLHQEVPDNLEIEVRSSKNLPYPIAHTTSFLDWQKTILDLKEREIVKTKESRSFFKENSIKFWFSDEDEITAVDVDYLGTKLSYKEDRVLINRILEEWKKLNL